METKINLMNWNELCEYEQQLFMKVFGLQVLFAENKQLSLRQAIEFCQYCKELSILSKRRQVIFQTEANTVQQLNIIEFYNSPQFARAMEKRKQLFDISQMLLKNPQIADQLDEQIPQVMMKTADPAFFQANVSLLNISTETVLLWNQLQNEFDQLDSKIIYKLSLDQKVQQFFQKDSVQTAAPSLMQWQRIKSKIDSLGMHDLLYFEQQLSLYFMWLQVIYQANQTLRIDKARYFCYILKLYIFAANRGCFLVAAYAFEDYNEYDQTQLNAFLEDMTGKLRMYMAIYADLWGCNELRQHLDDYATGHLLGLLDQSFYPSVNEVLAANGVEVAMPEPGSNRSKTPQIIQYTFPALLQVPEINDAPSNTAEASQSQQQQEEMHDSDSVPSKVKRRRKQFRFLKQHEDMLVRLKLENPYETYVEIARTMTEAFGIEFTCKQLQQRWQRVSRPGLQKGHWKQQEDALLLDLFNKHQGELRLVQKVMTSRTILYIRERCKVLRLI